MLKPLAYSAVVVSLLLAAPASARERVERPPSPTPAPTVERVSGGECEVAGGWYDETRNVISLCPNADAFAREHEAGHAFDHFHLSGGERRRFASLIGRAGRPWSEWHVDEVMPDGTQIVSLKRDSLEEVFADAYALCRLRLVPGDGDWQVSTDYDPSGRTHRRVCGFIKRAA